MEIYYLLLLKMDIIKKYLLEAPILEKKYKCYTISESSHDCPPEDGAKLAQSGQENKYMGLQNHKNLTLKLFLVFHQEQDQRCNRGQD